MQILEALKRLLYGADVFISYSYRDGTVYASRLVEELAARGFSCFFDRFDVGVGQSLPGRTLRGLDTSRMLVVIATPEAVASFKVATEIERFIARHPRNAPINLIAFTRRPQQALWWHYIEDYWRYIEGPRDYYLEPDNALQTGVPSQGVLERIQTGTYLKWNATIRRLSVGVISCLSFLVSFLAVQIYLSATQQHIGVPGLQIRGLSLSLLVALMGFVGGVATATLLGWYFSFRRSARAKRMTRSIEQAGAAAFLRPFISYSHADKSFVKQLEVALSQRGVRCW